MFCNPAEKSGDPPSLITNEAAHLTCYEIDGDDDTVERTVTYQNQFADQGLLLKEYELLCVPSFKIAVRPNPDDNDDVD